MARRASKIDGIGAGRRFSRELAALGTLASIAAFAPPAAGANALGDLDAQPCPVSFPLELQSYSPEAVSTAKAGDFSVGGVGTHLEPPIDWNADPAGARTYRHSLNDLTFLDPLFYAYQSSGDHDALAQAIAILADFARAHRHIDTTRHLVWERERTAQRAIRMAYALRAGACAGVLGEATAKLLLRTAAAHGRFLASTPNTHYGSNHDLLQDTGLLALADYLPFHPAFDGYADVGTNRFERAIRLLVDPHTGVHLEHTASYQMLSVRRVRDFVGLLQDPDPFLEALLARMIDVSSWFVMPDGTLPPLGDTPFGFPAPDFALNGSADDAGISPTFGSGFEMVKEPGSYLAATAGYHRPSHKQADELSFDLFESGREIIEDSARDNPGRGPRGAKAFTLSAQAHSTLTVDGRSFPLDGDFYGNAIQAVGSGDGWFAIEGHNPLLRPVDIHHRRLFLYKPGQALVIIDRVRSRRAHHYTRYVQIAPDLTAGVTDRGARLHGEGGFAGRIWSAKVPHWRKPKIKRGQLRPLRGWYAPAGISRLAPRDTLEIRSAGRSFTGMITVGLTAAPVHGRPTATGARVDIPGRTPVDVVVTRDGPSLAVTSRPAG